MQLSHQVLIVGAGPAGLMLAGELSLAGVDVAIVERRLDQSVEGSRASGLHARSLEILDQRGIAERFIAQGTKHYGVPFAGVILDASDMPTRHSYSLGLWQAKIEQTLADWTAELGVKIYRGCEVSSFEQRETHVEVQLVERRQLRSEYLVGCDGGRSLVRKLAGIDFAGWDPTLSYLIFEADMAEAPPLGMRYGERGVYALGKLDGGERIRGVVTEQSLEREPLPTDVALRAALAAAYGSDFGVDNITWLSRFTDAARQAATYRDRRVLLAGDAAHVHSPVGGQGLNIGLHDAFNLGWKLAQVVNGISPDTLLDTYQAERHPVGAALLQRTLALTAMSRGDDRTTALRAFMAETMQQDEPRRRYVAAMHGLDICYRVGEGHPLLGRRMPDLDLDTTSGPTRLFEHLRDGRPLFVDLGTLDGVTRDHLAAHLKLVDARFEGEIVLPTMGQVDVPKSILIRPDGHVAWAGEGDLTGLGEACQGWFA